MREREMGEEEMAFKMVKKVGEKQEEVDGWHSARWKHDVENIL